MKCKHEFTYIYNKINLIKKINMARKKGSPFLLQTDFFTTRLN